MNNNCGPTITILPWHRTYGSSVMVEEGNLAYRIATEGKVKLVGNQIISDKPITAIAEWLMKENIAPKEGYEAGQPITLQEIEKLAKSR